VVGTSMNFGLTGPIAERGLLVAKDLIEIEVAEHRHRANGLSDLTVRVGARIVAVHTPNVVLQGVGVRYLAEELQKLRQGSQATYFSAPSHTQPHDFLPQKKFENIPHQTGNLHASTTQRWEPARKRRIVRFGRAKWEMASEMSKSRGRTFTEAPKRSRP
jgi:hypothetical protein